MEANLVIKELQVLSSQLLDTDLTEERAEKVVQELHLLLSQCTGQSAGEPSQAMYKDYSLEYGNAISAFEASKCVLDTWRTVKFCRGLYSAIQEKKSSNKGERLNILYAGCGPYALFMTLVAPFFEPSELGFTLLEVNPPSHEMAGKLINDLELGAYVDALMLQDAITYTFPTDKQFHILLSETMDKALFNEAFVPIFQNLNFQKGESATFIPANVTVGATLFPPIETKDGVSPTPKDIKGLNGLDLGEIYNLVQNSDAGNEKTAKSPVEGLHQYGHIAFTTEVRVWQDIILAQWESLITLPKIERLNAPIDASFIQFEYPMAKALGVRTLFS